MPKNVYFLESFQSYDKFSKNWKKSLSKKDFTDERISKYDGIWSLEEAQMHPQLGDYGLVLKSKGKHSAISSLLWTPFVFNGSTFVFQYEVKLQRGLDCGGAYVKLLRQQPNLNLSDFNDRSPFTIMFGPDKCGNDLKIHLILSYKNPLTAKFEEKYVLEENLKIDYLFKDQQTHLYTLIIKKNNWFGVLVDDEELFSGNLLTHFKPPINPPKEIDDPSDLKPLDWPDDQFIPDPKASKPDDWDDEREFIEDPFSPPPPLGWLEEEEEFVRDPRAIKPFDWDEEVDGTWEPPLIPNPACEEAVGCGKWKAPLIKNPHFKFPWKPPMVPNPLYKGVWKPRKIQNPNYYYDPLPYNLSTIVAVGIEIWSMSSDIQFDNLIITSNMSELKRWTRCTWKGKHLMEKSFYEEEKLSLVDRVAIAASENPLWWPVIILSIVFPTLIFIVCCCQDEKYRQKKDEELSKQKNESTSPPSSSSRLLSLHSSSSSSSSSFGTSLSYLSSENKNKIRKRV